MRMIGAIVLCVMYGAPAAPAEPSRYYGNVPFSLDPIRGPSFVPQHLLEDSNLVVLHFDFWGVPWRGFAGEEPLPPAWLASMDEIEAFRRKLGLPVFLALTPVSGSRDALAPLATGEQALNLDELFSPPCERIRDRSDADDLRQAYAAYVEHMVERFDPTSSAWRRLSKSRRATCVRCWMTPRRSRCRSSSGSATTTTSPSGSRSRAIATTTIRGARS